MYRSAPMNSKTSRQELAAEPGQEALLELANHALDLAFGLGAIGPACARHHAKQGAEVDPVRRQDGAAIAWS